MRSAPLWNTLGGWLLASIVAFETQHTETQKTELRNTLEMRSTALWNTLAGLAPCFGSVKCISFLENLQKEKERGCKVHLLTAAGGGVTTILCFLPTKQHIFITIISFANI